MPFQNTLVSTLPTRKHSVMGWQRWSPSRPRWNWQPASMESVPSPVASIKVSASSVTGPPGVAHSTDLITPFSACTCAICAWNNSRTPAFSAMRFRSSLRASSSKVMPFSPSAFISRSPASTSAKMPLHRLRAFSSPGRLVQKGMNGFTSELQAAPPRQLVFSIRSTRAPCRAAAMAAAVPAKPPPATRRSNRSMSHFRPFVFFLHYSVFRPGIPPQNGRTIAQNGFICYNTRKFSCFGKGEKRWRRRCCRFGSFWRDCAAGTGCTSACTIFRAC